MQQRHLVQREVAGIDYGIRVLTLEEIETWFLSVMQSGETLPAWKRWLRKLAARLRLVPRPLPDAARSPVDIMLFEDFVLFDLRYLTTLAERDIKRLTPGQIRQVWAGCQEVNQDFFGMRARMETVGASTMTLSGANSSLRSPG